MLQVVKSVPYSATERIRSRPNIPAPRVSPRNEVVITWGPETEIRPGDLVIVEHTGYGYPSTDILEARKGIFGVHLETRDGYPIPVEPGEKILHRGELEIVIKGIARGSYLAF